MPALSSNAIERDCKFEEQPRKAATRAGGGFSRAGCVPERHELWRGWIMGRDFDTSELLAWVDCEGGAGKCESRGWTSHSRKRRRDEREKGRSRVASEAAKGRRTSGPWFIFITLIWSKLQSRCHDSPRHPHNLCISLMSTIENERAGRGHEARCRNEIQPWRVTTRFESHLRL